MANKLVTLTDAVTSASVKVNAGSIIRSFAVSGGTRVSFSNNGARTREITASQSQATIKTDAANLINVTVNSLVISINADRIIFVEAEGSGSRIVYNDEGAFNDVFSVSETPAAVEAAVDAL